MKCMVHDGRVGAFGLLWVEDQQYVEKYHHSIVQCFLSEGCFMPNEWHLVIKQLTNRMMSQCC